ncbi:MAG: hypothetical protein ACRDYB_04970 [Acidimicrobiales bacterium]
MTALLVAVALAGAVNVVLTSVASGPAAAALPGTAMPLQEFVNDGAFGRAWNDYNDTSASAGPIIDGRPSPIEYGLTATVHIYARANNGDLTEFINDGAAHRLWNSYDITRLTHGPTISADPDATFYGPVVHVYAEASNGDLIEYVNDGAGGRLWNPYDLTQLASGPTLGGDATPLVNATTDRVFARSASGDLVMYVNDGAGGQLWNSYDLTAVAGSTGIAGDANPTLVGSAVQVFAAAPNGDLVQFSNDGAGDENWSASDLTAATKGPAVSGRPSPVVAGGAIDVFARAHDGNLALYTAPTSASTWTASELAGPPMAGDPSAIAVAGSVHAYVEAQSGALVEYASPGAGPSFSASDLTAVSGGTPIGGSPGALLYGTSSIHVYAGGPPPAGPPAGVGLYGLVAGQPTSQAIQDNWPIIGDTGALGTQSAPYTGMNLGADLTTGQDIAGSGRRVTWLSFWTVSGPVSSNPDGSACFTSDCYYQDAFGAGQYVAHTIDAYAGQGLHIKPDWVIIDPEGFPDNHSGLDSGPGSSDANWSSYLTGWAQGLVSVDPGLHAGFYANQAEYNNFDLSTIQLPAFVAVAFPSPQDILTNQASNVAGFIAFGATCPAGPEEQTLVNPPWNGGYNTLQFEGQYCGP